MWNAFHFEWTCLVAQTVKNLPAMQETSVQSLGREDPWEKGMQTTPVFLPGKSYGQRSLVGYSPWGRKQLDMRNPPGSSVCGIFQARILEWVAISFSRGSSQPRDQTQVSFIAGRFFTVWATMVGIYKLDLINMFLNSLLYISLLGKLQVFMKWSMTFLL